MQREEADYTFLFELVKNITSYRIGIEKIKDLDLLTFTRKSDKSSN